MPLASWRVHARQPKSPRCANQPVSSRFLHRWILYESQLARTPSPRMYRAPAAITLCTSSTARNSRRARRHYRGTARRRDHYRTLEIAYDASEADVKGAFRRLAKESHPDLHPGDASAVARFQRLVDAHSTLTDDSARRAYDPVWKSASAPGAPDNSSQSHFTAMTRLCWLRRVVTNRHRHAIEQASRRWHGCRREDSA